MFSLKQTIQKIKIQFLFDVKEKRTSIGNGVKSFDRFGFDGSYGGISDIFVASEPRVVVNDICCCN